MARDPSVDKPAGQRGKVVVLFIRDVFRLMFTRNRRKVSLDRVELPAPMREQMRREILAVVSKYVDIDSTEPINKNRR